jgi:hypothetical protein
MEKPDVVLIAAEFDLNENETEILRQLVTAHENEIELIYMKNTINVHPEVMDMLNQGISELEHTINELMATSPPKVLEAYAEYLRQVRDIKEAESKEILEILKTLWFFIDR